MAKLICALALVVALPLPCWGEGTQPTVAAFVLSREEEGPLAHELTRSIRWALEQGKRVKQQNLLEVLHAGDEPLAGQNLPEALSRIAQAKEAYARADVASALEILKSSMSLMLGALGYMDDLRPLQQALTYMGASQMALGKRKQGVATLQQLLVAFPQAAREASAFPPDVQEGFEQAARKIKALPFASLTVSSQPQGASVFVDGRYVGITPVGLKDIKGGDHFVALRRDGHLPHGEIVTLRAGERKLNVPLQPARRNLLLVEGLQQAAAELGGETLGPGIEQIMKLLLLDRLILFYAQSAPTGEITLRAATFDMSIRRKIMEESMTMSWDSAGFKALQELTNRLAMAQSVTVPLGGPSPQADQPTSSSPFYKTWWFWTVVGVASAAAVATTLGVVLTGGEERLEAPPGQGGLYVQF